MALLPDRRLGSVRQLADPAGVVVRAQGYTPFGVPLWSMGNATSSYGFTEEQRKLEAAIMIENSVGLFILTIFITMCLGLVFKEEFDKGRVSEKVWVHFLIPLAELPAVFGALWMTLPDIGGQTFAQLPFMVRLAITVLLAIVLNSVGAPFAYKYYKRRSSKH